MSKSKDSKPSGGKKNTVDLPIRWHFPGELSPVPSNHLVVQQDGLDVYLSFFAVQPPLLPGSTNEDREKALRELEYVDATCVARVVVNKGRIQGMIEALQALVEPK